MWIQISLHDGLLAMLERWKSLLDIGEVFGVLASKAIDCKSSFIKNNVHLSHKQKTEN